MFSAKLSAFATLLCLAAIPVARSVEIPVTVGGPGGTIAYTPNFVVRLGYQHMAMFNLLIINLST